MQVKFILSRLGRLLIVGVLIGLGQAPVKIIFSEPFSRRQDSGFPGHVLLCLVVVTLSAGCGPPQAPSPETTGTPSTSKEVMPQPTVTDTGPAEKPTAVANPQSAPIQPIPSGEAADPAAVIGEESVEDILAQLNAINIDEPGLDGGTLGDPDKLVALMDEGNKLFREENLDEALEKFSEALNYTDNGEDPDVSFNMAIVYTRKGKLALLNNQEEAEKNFDDAVQHYEKALEIAPEYAEVHNNLGNLLKDRKQYDEAIRHYETSLKIIPDNSTTFNNLGTVHAIKGQINKAAVHFAKAVRLQPEYFDARLNLGNSYLQQGRVDAAIPELEAALRLAKGVAWKYERARRAMARAQQMKRSP